MTAERLNELLDELTVDLPVTVVVMRLTLALSYLLAEDHKDMDRDAQFEFFVRQYR